MVECQWDSVVPPPYFPVLTDVKLTFMAVTGSNSGLFSTTGFIVSPVGKRERVGGINGRKEKGNRKGKEGRKKE